MTAVSDLRESNLATHAGLFARRLRAWAFKRGRRVLPLYEPERATWWAVLRRLLLLATVCFIAFFYGLLVSVLPPFLLVPFTAPPAILLLVVIWALPEAPRAPLGALARVFMIFTVLAFVWPNYLAFSFGGLPWISVRRLIGAVAVILFLIPLSVSTNFRSQLRAVLGHSPWISRAIIAFIAVEAISTVTSSSPGETINRFVDSQIMWTGMFFIAAWFFGSGERNIGRWVNALIWVVVILTVMGLIEYRMQHIIWADHIPSFLQIQDEAVKDILRPNFRDRYRVVTTFTSPLSYGEFLALTTPMVLHKLVNSKGLWRISLWLAFDVWLLVAAFLSGARLAMVGFLVAHALYFLLWGIRRWRTHPGGIVGVALTMLYPALLIVLVGLITSVDAFRTRVLGGGAAQMSNDARREQFNLAVPAIAQRPLFGYGLGEGAGAVGWRTLDGKLSIDSGFISMAADFGLLGFAFFFGAILAAMIGTARTGILAPGNKYPLNLAMATIFGVLLTTRSVLSQGDNNPMVFMFLGLSLALIYRSNTARKALPGSGQGMDATHG